MSVGLAYTVLGRGMVSIPTPQTEDYLVPIDLAYQCQQHCAVQPTLAPPLGQHTVLQHRQHHPTVPHTLHLDRLGDRRESTNQHDAAAVSKPIFLVVAMVVVLLERSNQRRLRGESLKSDRKGVTTRVERGVDSHVLQTHVLFTAVEEIHRLIDRVLDLFEHRIEDSSRLIQRFLFRIQQTHQVFAILCSK